MKAHLLKKIQQKDVLVGVIGLGYVGLPLAVNFALSGLRVLGFEKDGKKVENVNAGINYIADVEDAELKDVTGKKLLEATLDFSKIADCDALIICVPTPLDKFKKPDLTYVEDSTATVGKYMTKGSFVCLESTTFPTTTEDYIAPILERETGFKKEVDFWVAFSPERVDPGNQNYTTRNTPKILGALSSDGLEIGEALYKHAVESIYPVSSPRVAEMAKILENTYRLVNISLINELALLANQMNIDIWEVIEAAKTKPYGFQAFYPGPGIGGHCIPLDPFYLEYIAAKYHFDLTMIHTAGQIDTLMPHRMMVKVNFALNKVSKPLRGSKILILGVAYKPNIADDRESPALKLIDELVRKGAVVSYSDSFIPVAQTANGHTFDATPLTPEIVANADCVVVATRHSNVNYDMILENAQLIVDLQNVYGGKTTGMEKVVKL
ncbi:MAG: nucleotide sugar dehydrogenase [Deltaproteobacteria bacterium]|nr:nucleotide sugar dehydrogenase [Deltaproteobacteria bacterium]